MRANIYSVAGMVITGCLAIGPIAALAQDPGTGANPNFGRRGGFQRGQRGPGGQFGSGGQFGPGGQFGRGQGNFGPGGMMGRGMFGMMGGQADKNPLVSHIYELVQRPDVQSEINMDLRQKNALAQYQGQVPGMIRQQMQQQMQSLRRGGGAAGTDQGQDPQAQRQQMRDQRMQQMQQTRSQIQTTINQGLTEILRPEQLARLAQLDLQWRGVLSIADPTVGEQVHATPEHRTAVNGILSEYQSKVRDARQQAMEKMRAERQAAATNAGQPGSTGGIRQDPFIVLERGDAAARKEAEEKALKLLSAEEKDLWGKVQGRIFTFRTDIKTPQR